jgi:hypothetical protein
MHLIGKKTTALLSLVFVFIVGCAQNKKYTNKMNIIYEVSKKNQQQGTNNTTIKNASVRNMAIKLYEPATATYPTPKGIIVVGGGNNENAPTEGKTDGTTENSICKLAADNGYIAVVLGYSKGPGTADWNTSAAQIGMDFDTCINQLANLYKLPNTKSIIVGVSYTSFLLYTNIALSDKLSYCKGLIATCGSTDNWKAQNFKIPIYAINCDGNYEGDLNGKALYDAIPANSPIKTLSDGYTDATCNSHCGGNWVQLMFDKIKMWLP